MEGKRKIIRLAFGSVPKDGGTFTFYRNIRPELARQNIEIYCVALGKQQARIWEDAYADDHCVLLLPDSYNIKNQAKAFVQWCDQKGIHVVMGINSEAILSAIPHLPKHIRVISRCANAFDHGYRITMSGKERLEAIIALTPRLRDDLINSYDANPDLIHLIPNGIDSKKFEKAAQSFRGKKKEIQLGFLGRLEHTQKGVLHLPPLIKELELLEVPYKLRIAGKGRDKDKLALQLFNQIKGGKVELLGALNPDQVPTFLGETDVFIFPSHFEGCPNALLEAMMAGCVPVSWVIKGITDFVIKDQYSGFLFETGDYSAMAEQINILNSNRGQIEKLSNVVVKEAKERFTPFKTAVAYAKVIKEILDRPFPEVIVKKWDAFKVDENFREGWKKLIPENLYAFFLRLKNDYWHARSSHY